MKRRLLEDSEDGEQKANTVHFQLSEKESDVALTTWENLEEGAGGWPVLSKEDFNDNVTVARFAANNNTSRLLENTSNNSDSTRTYILIITLYTNTHERNIQQHCHASWYESCGHEKRNESL